MSMLHGTMTLTKRLLPELLPWAFTCSLHPTREAGGMAEMERESDTGVACTRAFLHGV